VSGEVVIFNVMGGMGTLVGPFAGAAFFLLLREGVSRFFTEYYLIPVGILFILMVIFLPQGLLRISSPPAESLSAGSCRPLFGPQPLTNALADAQNTGPMRSTRCVYRGGGFGRALRISLGAPETRGGGRALLLDSCPRSDACSRARRES